MANYVHVYSANGQLDAEMIRIFLQSHGIRAESLGESVGTIYGLTVTPLGEVKIMVPEEQAAEALRLLADMESGALENEDFLPTDDSNSDDIDGKAD